MALTDNLVSYWNFDESSGNAADAHASNDLTNNNTASFVAAKISNGADLERASSQSFTIADASQSGLDFSDALTFAGWVNFETFDSETHFIAKRLGTGNQRSYDFRSGAGNNLTLVTFTDGTNVGCNVSVSWTPSTGVWYHVGVTKSGTSVKFYVDGAQQGTTQTGSNATIFNGTAKFDLGANSDDSQYSDGIFDEWGVWSRALSDAEIAELYSSGDGLAYPFDGGGTALAPSLALLGVGT